MTHLTTKKAQIAKLLQVGETPEYEIDCVGEWLVQILRGDQPAVQFVASLASIQSHLCIDPYLHVLGPTLTE